MEVNRLLLIAGVVASATIFCDLTTAAAGERFDVIETDQSGAIQWILNWIRIQVS
jgi:hypothetical protein